MKTTDSIAKILFVEDDETLAFVTADSLRQKGFEVLHCDNGNMALELFKKEDPDLCLLDVMIPGMDGFQLAEKIREIDEQIPVLFLTARVLKEDRIHGLSIGGDDYITKPFSIEELVLRMKVFIKRKTISGPDNNGLITCGDFTLDHANLLLLSPVKEQKLTMTESELLKLFFRNTNKVLKREEILISVWGDDSLFLSRSLDVFISRLRKFLSAAKGYSLVNIRSIGFMLKTKK